MNTSDNAVKSKLFFGASRKATMLALAFFTVKGLCWLLLPALLVGYF